MCCIPGGHTAEMMALLKGMDASAYTPRCYVVAETDRMSGQKAVSFEESLAGAKEEQKEAAEGELAAAMNAGCSPAATVLPATNGPLPAGVQTRQRAAAAAVHRGTLGQRQQLDPGRAQQAGQHGGDSGGVQDAGSALTNPYRVVRIPRSRWGGKSLKGLAARHSTTCSAARRHARTAA